MCRKTVIQFIKFGVIGISNTLISLIIYYLCVWIRSDWYLWGNVAGWFVSVLNAFYWNNKCVFQSQDRSKTRLLACLGKTYISYGGTFLLSTALLWLQVQVLGVSELVAPLVNLVITVPLNFLLNKFWAFR